MLVDVVSDVSVAVVVGPLLVLGVTAFVAKLFYNAYLHPLAHIPGPVWSRMSGIPSWYHAVKGDRHIWLWQNFQIYGDRIRVTPGTVIFCDPAAYTDIYGMKSNVRRSKFYTAWRRNESDITTLNTVDVHEHARKRKLLSQCFTEKSIRAASHFITSHVDRWNELLVDGDGEEWSSSLDFSRRVNHLVFDIMGDLCFGRSFDIKEPEPEKNPLSVIPHNIAEYMKFYYPITRSPFLDFVVWLKPRGLNQLFEVLTPPAVKHYYQFVHDSVTKRTQLQKEQALKPEDEHRQDMFYFLCNAVDPDTGKTAYDDADLRAEANLLIIAGSDTTSISLSGIFFYLTGDHRRLQKLTEEIRTIFPTTEDIVHGPRLLSCRYLKACVDEGMRLTPSGPSELSREVLPGGINIRGQHYPEGTVVGTAGWCNSRSKAAYGDCDTFRPERWIENEAAGVTKEDVARARSNFHPFSSGPGNCVGKNLAMTEMLIVVARTLHRLDVRRTPGSTAGGGTPERGWGARDREQYQLYDAYISLCEGPMVQFKKRAVA